MNELFANAPKTVRSSRVLYTASFFARSSLLYLQETGSLAALRPHVSRRSGLSSYLCFLVEDGAGTLEYGGQKFQLKAGDVVFLDCMLPYAHESSMEDLWTLRWCHFQGISMAEIYGKYCQRGGQPVLHTSRPGEYRGLLSQLQTIAEGQDYIRDMQINVVLSQLLALLMADSWNPEKAQTVAKKRMELDQIRAYLDDHYTERITLDSLSSRFFINKHYLTKIFRESYGTTIVSYLNQRKITRAKHLLRFTELSMEEIAQSVGMTDANYFSRTFQKIEGMRPSQFRSLWRPEQ